MAKDQISKVGGKYGPGITNDANLGAVPQDRAVDRQKGANENEAANGGVKYQPSNGLFENRADSKPVHRGTTLPGFTADKGLKGDSGSTNLLR